MLISAKPPHLLSTAESFGTCGDGTFVLVGRNQFGQDLFNEERSSNVHGGIEYDLTLPVGTDGDAIIPFQECLAQSCQALGV